MKIFDIFKFDEVYSYLSGRNFKIHKSDIRNLLKKELEDLEDVKILRENVIIERDLIRDLVEEEIHKKLYIDFLDKEYFKSLKKEDIFSITKKAYVFLINIDVLSTKYPYIYFEKEINDLNDPFLGFLGYPIGYLDPCTVFSNINLDNSVTKNYIISFNIYKNYISNKLNQYNRLISMKSLPKSVIFEYLNNLDVKTKIIKDIIEEFSIDWTKNINNTLIKYGFKYDAGNN